MERGRKREAFKNRISSQLVERCFGKRGKVGWLGGERKKGGGNEVGRNGNGKGRKRGDELNFAGGMVGGRRLSRGDKRSKRDINSRGV